MSYRSVDGSVDSNALLRRVSGRPGAINGVMETKTSDETTEKSCINEPTTCTTTPPHEKLHYDDDGDLPPLQLDLLTNRTLNGVNAFLRGQVGLCVSMQRTNKEMCKTLLTTLGYSMYDLREVNVSYVANGCIDAPSRSQGPIHPGTLHLLLTHTLDP